MEKIRKYFITGLITIVPVYLTIYLFVIIFKFIDGILGGIVNQYLQTKLGFYIPGLGLILFIFTVLLIGFLASRIVFKNVILQLEHRFKSLPLVKSVYPAFKQLVDFIFGHKELGFKKVVLVEYPSKGIWSIAFLTNEESERIDKIFGCEMATVFVPGAPGPISGYVIFVAKKDIKFPDITVSDALKIIISGGVFKF